MLPLFSGQLHFGTSYFFTLFLSTYFDTTVTFSGYLFLQNSCCFVLFHLFRTVTFSQDLFFQNSFFFGAKILQSSHFLRIQSSLQQLLFGTAFSEELFRIKISKKRATFSKQVLLHSINLFRKGTFLEKTDFSENQFPHYLLFLESCLFRATTFSKDATFYSSYLFRRATFLQHTFSEELLFHSYSSIPQLHYLLIRQ